MKMGSAISIFNNRHENGHKRLFSKPCFDASETGLSVKQKAARYFIRAGYFKVYPPAANGIIRNEQYGIDFSKFKPGDSDSWSNKMIRKKVHEAALDMAHREKWDALVSLIDSGGLAVSPPKSYRDCAECRRFWFDELSGETGKEKPAVADYIANNLRWLIRHYGYDSAGPIKEFFPDSQDLIRKNSQVYADRKAILRMGDELNRKLMKRNGDCTPDEKLVLVKLKAGLPLERRLMYPSLNDSIREKFVHELFDSGPSAEDFSSKLEKFNRESGKRLVFRFNSRRLGFLLEKIAEFPMPNLAARRPIAFLGKDRVHALMLGETSFVDLEENGKTCFNEFVLRQRGKCLEVHRLKEGKVTKGMSIAGLDYFLECRGGRIRAKVDALQPLMEQAVCELVVHDRKGGKYLARREGGEIRIYKDDASVLRGMYKPIKKWQSADIISSGYASLLDHHTLYWHLNFGFAPEGQEMFKSAPDIVDLYAKMDMYNAKNGTSIHARLDWKQMGQLEKPDSVVLVEDGKYKIRSTGNSWLFFETFEPWELDSTLKNAFVSARLFASGSKPENKSALKAYLSTLTDELRANAMHLEVGESMYIKGSQEGDYRITRGKGGLEAWSDKRSVIARAVLQLEKEHGITDPRRITFSCFKGNDGLLTRASYIPFILVKIAHPELLPEDMKFPPKLPTEVIRARALKMFSDWDGWFSWKYPNDAIGGDPIVSWKRRQAPNI